MTAPIRSQSELLDAIRARRDELNISHETIDDIAGFAKGYTSKLLAPEPMKNLGPMSLGALIGALGIALVAVPDPEAARLVEKRWIKRKRPQKLPPALLVCVKREEVPDTSKQHGGSALMQFLGTIGGKASGKTRRAKAMRRRELQTKRAHAARVRWSKHAEAARFKDGKGKQRAATARARAKEPAKHPSEAEIVRAWDDRHA